MKQVAIATLDKLETVPSFTLKTDGRGLWTKEAREVRVTNIEFDTPEIRVFFDTKKWPVEEFGLIYTDPGFIKGLRAALAERFTSCFNWKRLDYTEQGMQGDDYVSLELY